MPRSSSRSAVPAAASGVRVRTRALLVDAALRVFARKGAGAAAIHEIAAEAGVANGTFYNYFRTREELVDAASLRLVERLHADVADRAAAIDDPAERVAIGSRRFVLEALRDPVWGAAIVRVWSASPVLHARMATPVRADLRTGRRRGRFAYASEAAAADLLEGTVLAGMRTVLEGRAGAEHAGAVAALVLRGLGVPAAAADAIVARPLPSIVGASTPAAPGAVRRRGRAAGRRR